MERLFRSITHKASYPHRDNDGAPPMALGVILACAALLRFFGLAAESFWYDETYSVWVAGHSVAWHIALSTQRIFPPLYYLCLHFWLWFGSLVLPPAAAGSEYAVRALSVLIGLASILVAYALAARLFDRRVGLWSAALLAISPLHIWYSQEARMYILVAALGLCSAYAMLLALEEGGRRHWLAYVLSTALVMNAHYFAVFLVPFQNAYVFYLLLRRRAGRPLLLRWLVSQVAVGLLSVIGLAGIFSSESGYWWGLLDSWHGAPGISELLDLMFSFSLGNTAQGPLLYRIGLVVFGLCIVANAVALILSRSMQSPSSPAAAGRSTSPAAAGRSTSGSGLSKEMDGLVFVSLYLVVPLGAVFLFSQARSFWVLRYIFPFLPPYCILVARGIRSMPDRLRVVAIGMVLLLTAWPIANTYRHEQKENWRAATQYISAQEQPGDVIVLVDEDIWLPFEHYYRGSMRRLGISRAVDDRDLLTARVGMIAPGYQRLWLVLSHTDNWMLRDVLKSSPLAEPVSERSFTGVQVDLFLIHVDEPGESNATSLLQQNAGCTAP